VSYQGEAYHHRYSVDHQRPHEPLARGESFKVSREMLANCNRPVRLLELMLMPVRSQLARAYPEIAQRSGEHGRERRPRPNTSALKPELGQAITTLWPSLAACHWGDRQQFGVSPMTVQNVIRAPACRYCMSTHSSSWPYTVFHPERPEALLRRYGRSSHSSSQSLLWFLLRAAR
jgi:hypothetical protein